MLSKNRTVQKLFLVYWEKAIFPSGKFKTKRDANSMINRGKTTNKKGYIVEKKVYK